MKGDPHCPQSYRASGRCEAIDIQMSSTNDKRTDALPVEVRTISEIADQDYSFNFPALCRRLCRPDQHWVRGIDDE
jgi:hypothetical protein